jgi:rhodanese-related sulfurtransferase
MQDLSLFISNHLALTYAFAFALILLMVVEFLRVRRMTYRIDVKDAIQLINRKNAVIIDIRAPDLYRTGHIIDAISMTPRDILENPKKVEKFKSKPMIVVCLGGVESQKVAAFLLKEGYNAFSLSGGIRAWSEAELPLVKG